MDYPSLNEGTEGSSLPQELPSTLWSLSHSLPYFQGQSHIHISELRSFWNKGWDGQQSKLNVYFLTMQARAARGHWVRDLNCSDPGAKKAGLPGKDAADPYIQQSKYFLWACMVVSHRLTCFNAWAPVSGIVWEGLGGVALLGWAWPCWKRYATVSEIPKAFARPSLALSLTACGSDVGSLLLLYAMPAYLLPISPPRWSGTKPLKLMLPFISCYGHYVLLQQ